MPAPFSGDSAMTRHLLFATILIGAGLLLNLPAEAASGMRCEDRAANCVGRCVNPNGGTNMNKCMRTCDRHVISCLTRAHDAAMSYWNPLRQ
jgi:hypothetical protein